MGVVWRFLSHAGLFHFTMSQREDIWNLIQQQQMFSKIITLALQDHCPYEPALVSKLLTRIEECQDEIDALERAMETQASKVKRKKRVSQKAK